MASTSSECIICTGEYFVCVSGRVSGGGGSGRNKTAAKQKNSDVTTSNLKTWKTFIKYFCSPPGVNNEWSNSVWDMMGGGHRSSPFCLRCREIMQKLAHFHEQLEVIQNQVSKFVNTISNIIVHPDKSNNYDKDGNRRKSKRMKSDDDKYDASSIQNQINVKRILDERIAKKKGLSLPQAISSRFNQQLLHIPDWQGGNTGGTSSQRGQTGQLFNAAAGAAAYWQNPSLLTISAGTGNSGSNNDGSGSVETHKQSSSYEKLVHNGKYEYERLGTEFRCCTCGTVKSSRQLLMTHLNYHRLLDNKEHVCGTCGKAFIRKREVDRHERTHLNSVLDKYTGAVADLGDGRFSYEGEWRFEGIPNPDGNRNGDVRQFIRYRCSTCGTEKEKKASMLSHLRWVHHRKAQDMHAKDTTISTNNSNNSNNPLNMHTPSTTTTSSQHMHLITPSLQGFAGVAHNALAWTGHQR